MLWPWLLQLLQLLELLKPPPLLLLLLLLLLRQFLRVLVPWRRLCRRLRRKLAVARRHGCSGQRGRLESPLGEERRQ